jgi:hypothetical protein
MLTGELVMVLIALVLTIAAAVGRAPLWPAVFVLVILWLVKLLPVH